MIDHTERMLAQGFRAMAHQEENLRRRTSEGVQRTLGLTPSKCTPDPLQRLRELLAGV